jgi:DNA transformation protein
MSTSQSTLDYILDQTSAAKVSARKMFGEYTLYCNEKVIGLVCDDTLFIKITPRGKDFVGDNYHEGPPYAGAKPALVIDSGQIEDDEWLAELISITEKSLPAPKKKPARKPKKKQ